MSSTPTPSRPTPTSIPRLDVTPITPGLSAELLAQLRDQARTTPSYHRAELLRRTLRRLAIVDLTAHGWSRAEICRVLKASRATVTKWRARYRTASLASILGRLSVRKPGPRH